MTSRNGRGISFWQCFSILLHKPSILDEFFGGKAVKDLFQLSRCYGGKMCSSCSWVSNVESPWSFRSGLLSTEERLMSVKYLLNSSPICWGSVITSSLIFIFILYLVWQWVFLLLFVVFQIILFISVKFIILFIACRDFSPWFSCCMSSEVFCIRSYLILLHTIIPKAQ